MNAIELSNLIWKPISPLYPFSPICLGELIMLINVMCLQLLYKMLVLKLATLAPTIEMKAFSSVKYCQIADILLAMALTLH